MSSREIHTVVENMIEKWHTTPNITSTLYDYLGLTWDEYSSYVMDDELPDNYIPPTR